MKSSHNIRFTRQHNLPWVTVFLQAAFVLVILLAAGFSLVKSVRAATPGIPIGSETDRTQALTLGDVDGDGDLDVLVANIDSQTNKVYLNDGSGGFSNTGILIGNEMNVTYALTLGDVDGDGDLDVLTGNYDQTNKLYLNDGSGGFSATGVAIGSEADGTLALTLGDVDNDGDLDVLAGNFNSQINKLYLNNGSGGFSANGLAIGSEADDTIVLTLGDMDGDGDLDVLTGNKNQTNKLYLNNGSGGFSATGVPIGNESDDTRSLAYGDVDGDGDLDVLAGNFRQTNRLYLNDRSGGFSDTGVVISSEENYTRTLMLVDGDGDGDLDVLEGNVVQTNMLYLNDGSGGFSATGVPIGNEADNTEALMLGDVDGDGDLDLMAGNDGQTNKLYLNNGGFLDTDGDGTGNNADIDDDDDGLPDTYELTNGLDPLNALDAMLDNDSDNLSNLAEFVLGTDINNRDTDGDGLADNIDNDPLLFELPETLVRISFSYIFEGNLNGTSGHVLAGVIDGLMFSDNDTVVITGFREASLAGFEYQINTQLIGVRAVNPVDRPKMSISGKTLDFWVCVKGFSFIDGTGGGDCPFGTEGGFLMRPVLLTPSLACQLANSGDGECDIWARAGIPELGADYRDGDFPINKAHWSAVLIADTDGDGVPDSQDDFPSDPNETTDTDGDGTGDQADTDDDADGLPDVFETDNGLDPLDPTDATADADDDGYSNLAEFDAGTDINDPESNPFVPPEELVLVQQYREEPAGTPSFNVANYKLHLSPDGRHLYAAGGHFAFRDQPDRGAMIVFDRNVADGSLTHLQSIVHGVDVSVMVSASDVAVSADGRHVYVAASTTSFFGGRYLVFNRAENGELTELAAENIGMANRAIEISPDGASVYIGGSHGLSSFSRATDGTLTELVDSDEPGHEVDDITISGDGTSLYTAGSRCPLSGTTCFPLVYGVVPMLRNPTTGELTAGEPIEIPELNRTRRLVLSRDGRYLFASGSGITIFERDPDGSLTFASHLANVGDGGANALPASSDGQRVFANGVLVDTSNPDGATVVDDVEDLISLSHFGHAADPGFNHLYSFGYNYVDKVYGLSLFHLLGRQIPDVDEDGIADGEDNCVSTANPTQLDSDADGLGDACDADDDNDGIIDSDDVFPLIAIGDLTDTDNDGAPDECDEDCQNLGMSADEDDDGDGIADNFDNNPLVFDEVDPTLISGKVIKLPDITLDGVADLGILKVDSNAGQALLEVLNGFDLSAIKTIIWADIYVDTTLALHVIPDMNDNGFDEVGLFGIQDKENNEGKPQVFVRDLQTGNRINVYNWPANWKEVSALVLDDMTGDGIAEIAIQGRFFDGNRPQLIIKTGNTNNILATYSYPDLFVSPQYYQHSDINGDGFKEIATFGRLLSNNKIQTKMADGTDADSKLPAYNFPDKWDNVSWHRLDDSNGDGQDDWGMFGTLRSDGRPQLINKDGVSPVGALRIFAWPAEIQNAQFYRIPDMNNDGVDEVAAAGRRSNNGRYQFQIQDGTDRNTVLANHNLNLNLESVMYHVLPDLSGDEKVEIGFLGMNSQGEYELVIQYGDTANGEYATYNLGNDWQSAPAITSLGDTDDNGLPDLLIYGQNATGEQLVITSL